MLKKKMPFDGLFFDIHGAMSVEGIDDPEGDFITRIRECDWLSNFDFNINGFTWKCFFRIS